MAKQVGTPNIAIPTVPPARASLRSALPFFALALISLGAIAFDLSLPARLPSSGDYAEAAAFLRGHLQPGDAIQIWPPWLERARLFVDSGPVLAEEDLARADYPGAQKLWLLALPDSPDSGFGAAERALRSRGASLEGTPARFGPLSLAAWDLHAPPLAADLVFGAGPREWHEVQYVTHACRAMPVGGESEPARLLLSGAAGATLHLRAGIIGDRAYDPNLAPIRVEAFASGRRLAGVTLTRSRDPAPAWQGADVPSGATGDWQLELRASTPGPVRPPVCISAWTTR